MFSSNKLRLVLLPLLATGMLLISGCGGCRDDETAKEKAAKLKEEEEKKKKEKQKPPFEVKNAVILPGQYTKEIARNKTKLGHWVSADFRVIANSAAAQGELNAVCVDVRSRPVPIRSTNYYLSTARPASMPKGEWRNFETNIFLPRRDIKTSHANVSYSMKRAAGGLTMIGQDQGTMLLKPFQYHFVVLTNRPDAYAYVNVIDCVLIPDVTAMGERFPPFYQVVRTRPSKDPIPLPRAALNWTTIAYLLWDDLNPDQLDQQQAEAMLDWLHFGGQLILSSPDCLDKLQSSFLADYLPAKFDGTQNLVADDFAEINDQWAVPIKKNPNQKRTLNVTDQSPLLGVKFEKHPSASFVEGTGSLVVERQIGRGRIVATAFSLDDQPLLSWVSYRSFFNGCLLRRPAREFGESHSGTISFAWANDGTHIFDPLVGSTLRFLSRDLSQSGTPKNYRKAKKVEPQQPTNRWYQGRPYYADDEYSLAKKSTTTRNLGDKWHYGGYVDDPQSGTAGWNDQSGISVAARETLKEAAGISPPSSSFVLRMLAVYLVVLVPINWLLFKVIGRVEWAWIAAPIIAIAGAFSVAKMASLDIGFVRSNTQIGLLEVHADYPRGHLTEYSALYTSLSTGYDIDLDNHTSQSLPFAVGPNDRFNRKESISEVRLRRTRENRLEDLMVQSNSTGLLHTESILDLEGRFELISPDGNDSNQVSIENSTNLDLKDAGVIRRDDENGYQVAWIGDLPAGSESDRITFRDIPKDSRAEQWTTRPVYQSTDFQSKKIWSGHFPKERGRPVLVQHLRDVPELASRWLEYQRFLQRLNPMVPPHELDGIEIDFTTFQEIFRLVNSRAAVNAGRIFDAVSNNLELSPGEVRLIGYTGQKLGNTRISPASTQTDQKTLVLVHLRPPGLPLAERDVNSLVDFTGNSNLDWLEDFEDDLLEEEEDGEDFDEADGNDSLGNR